MIADDDLTPCLQQSDKVTAAERSYVNLVRVQLLYADG